MKKIKAEGASTDAIFLAFIKLLTTALSLVITRLLSEYLEIREYGTYSQIMLMVSTVASFTIFGMMDGTNYFYSIESDSDKKEAYVSTIWALQCFLSTIVGIVILVFSKLICNYFDNPDLKNLIIFAAVLPWAQNLLWILQSLIVAIGKAKTLAFRNLAVALIRLVVVLLVILWVRSIVIVLISTLILDILQMIFFLIVLRRNQCTLKFSRIDIGLIGDILRYCAPMAIFIMVNAFNRDMDKYLISLMTDTETLALYANASKQLPFDIVMTSFCTVLIPYITRYISEKKNKQAAELYKLFLEITYISTGILCMAALSVSPQLMKLLYSDKYINGVLIFSIYILVDLFRFTNITLVLCAAGKTKKLMLLGFGSLIVNAILNIILYKALSITGPAIATLVVTVLTGVLMLYFSAAILNTRISGFFDFKYLMYFASVGVILSLGLSILRNFLDGIGVHYFVTLIAVAGLYGVIMVLLNGNRLFSALRRVNHIGYDE